MEEKEIGVITHFFAHIGVAAIKMTDGVLNVGDTIKIKGTTTVAEEKIESMQVNKQSVTSAKKGDEVGIKLKNRVREHDKVFK